MPAASARRSGAAVTAGTVVVLTGLSALHVTWGRGSSFPFRTQTARNDAVVGGDATPSPTACYAVATLLAGAAASVGAAATGRGGGASRVMSAGVAAVLATRAALGFAGRTDLAVTGSDSARFRRNDRRLFSPLCLTLAVGAAQAARGAVS